MCLYRQRVIANRLARHKLYAIEEKSKEVVFVYCVAQRRCHRCKLVFSATITLPDLTRINL